MMIKKFLCLFLIVISAFLLFSSSASALSGTSYSDLPGSSSQVTNLINYAASYVCFRDSVNSYYCVWSDDITWSGSNISGTNVWYVRYYRNSTYDTWMYSHGTDSSFTFSTSYLVTSNITGLGSTSQVYEEYKAQELYTGFLVAIGSFVFALMLIRLRGGQNG